MEGFLTYRFRGDAVTREIDVPGKLNELMKNVVRFNNGGDLD